jgi:hypothetical protein
MAAARSDLIWCPRGADPEVLSEDPERLELARLIRKHWGDTLATNVAIGDWLAKLKPTKQQYQLNLLNLPMSFSWARRLIKISCDSRILENKSQMPGARGTLHIITLLKAGEFRKALRLRVINPNATRKDIDVFPSVPDAQLLHPIDQSRAGHT